MLVLGMGISMLLEEPDCRLVFLYQTINAFRELLYRGICGSCIRPRETGLNYL